MNLKKKAIDGVMWTFAQQFGVQGINFAVQIILARLLLPEVFGLVAMIQIFISLGQTLMDGGMTSSLIRTENLDYRDYSTVFFMNLFSSVVIYFILFSVAPYIALFFNQPILIPVIRVYTIVFVIQALVGVQTTRLTKEMNFKLQMYMQIPSTILGGITGVFLAYKGFGIWSIIWMNLIASSLFMLQHWFHTKWRPSFILDRRKLKYHFNFGYKITLSALLSNLYSNSFTLIVGKLFSATQLGFFNQANNLRMFPVTNLTAALQKVTYPVFSTLQNDDFRLKAVFKKINVTVFFIICPVMLSLIVVAEPLFRFVLTEKWLPSVPFFQILCFSAIVYPLSMYNLNIILAKGRSDMHLKLEIIKKGGSILFLLLIFPFGIWGAVYALAISMIIHAFVNSFYSGRIIDYPIMTQLKDLFYVFLIAISSMVSTFLFDMYSMKLFNLSDMVRIITTLLIYYSQFLFISFMTNAQGFAEVKNIILHGIAKMRK